MNIETILLLLVPPALMATGVMLLWYVSQITWDVDTSVPTSVRAARWVGAAMLVVGLLMAVAFMTHLLALFFVMATIVVLLAFAVRYQDSERQNLLWIMTTAAEHDIPLHQAVRSFAAERNDRVGEQAARLADYLEAGVPVGLSLQRAGVRVAPATRLAADLGQHTGTLGAALREVSSRSNVLEPAIRSLVQWLFYVGFLTTYIAIILCFSIIKLVPVIQRIFRDFGTPLPNATQWLSDVANRMSAHWYLLLPFAIVALLALAASLAYFVGFSIRHLPFIGRLWWRADVALILRWLATAIRQGRPAVEIIRLLAGYFPHPDFRRRLEQASKRIDRGAHWSDSLYQAGLIQQSDHGVFRAAERAGNLPWALEEMADNGVRRCAYRIHTFLDIAFPTLLVAFGAAVLFIALGLLLPLFSLIKSLT